MTEGDASRSTEFNTLIVAADLRDRKRNRDKSRLQCSEKRSDVVKPLWRQYHRPVTSRPAKSQLVRNI